MSYPLGTKIKLTAPWRAYSTGTVLEQGYEVDLHALVRGGIAVCLGERAEAESPGRPAVLAKRAADKIGAVTRRLRG